MSAERILKARAFPWERSADQQRASQTARRDIGPLTEQRQPRRAASENPPSRESILSCLPGLLRDAAEAINTAEARAEQVQAEMTRALEAAEERARSAEALAELLEKRATEAIRAAEERAEAAEEKLAAAEEWIMRIRDLTNRQI
jgi:hypothetical protein